MEQHIETTIEESQPTNEAKDKEGFDVLFDNFDKTELEKLAEFFANLYEVPPKWVKNSKTNKVEFFYREDHEKFKAFAVGVMFTVINNRKPINFF